MSITGLILQPTIIRGAALDYFRFMNGREVRARVVQGGAPGAMAVLRMGEHTIKARIQGVSIPAGKTLFVRIEKDGGGYRLITLDKAGVPTPGPGVPAASAAEIPAAVIASFREFVERARKKITAAVADKTRAAESPSGDGGKVTDKIALDTALMETLGRMARDESADTDGLMFLAWREDRDSERNPDEAGGSILGQGDFSAEPRHYFVHADLNRLGPLGILFVSPEEHFENFSIWLTPERAATERLLRTMLPGWKDELQSAGFKIKELALLPTASPDKLPGLDLRA